MGNKKMKTFKYRLNPSKSQRTKLMKTLEICRWVYNETLAIRKNAWVQERKTLSQYDTHRLIPLWKNEHPELREVHSQVLQNVQERVDLAYQAFFRRVKTNEKPGYPHFRKYGNYASFTFKQGGFSLRGKSLQLSKIGAIKMILHRPIEGRIKTLTIRKDTEGKWFASFACEIEPEILPPNEFAVGIDVGLESFATLSNGYKIANPRFFRREEKEIAKAQRKFTKSPKGTDERARRRTVVAHIHQRVANRRKDFVHKQSRELVNGFGCLVFEDINVERILQNNYLAKSISDVAWSQLIRYSAYKAEIAGRLVVLVDPSNTSKMCSNCDALVEKSLSDRVHKCSICGLVIDRDINAANNILRLGLQSLGKALEAPTDRSGE